MISAKEALALDQAQFPEKNAKQVLVLLDVLAQHIRKTMVFGGPEPIEIPCSDLGDNACLVVCYVMRRYGWDVKAQLISMEPRFAGGQPQRHHWIFRIAPLDYSDHPVMQQMADRHEASHALLS